MKYIIMLLLLAIPAHAEIYSWVDENGQKHFGDRVPDQYKQQAGNVELDLREPTAEEIAQTQSLTNELMQSRMRMESTPKTTYRSRKSSGSSNKKKTYKNDYERQKAEYDSAKACFAACQTRSPGAPFLKKGAGGSYVSPGRSVINNDACGHCKNVSKPQR